MTPVPMLVILWREGEDDLRSSDRPWQLPRPRDKSAKEAHPPRAASLSHPAAPGPRPAACAACRRARRGWAAASRSALRLPKKNYGAVVADPEGRRRLEGSAHRTTLSAPWDSPCSFVRELSADRRPQRPSLPAAWMYLSIQFQRAPR